MTSYKKDGFNGQRAIVLPKSIIHKFCLFNQIINKTYLTDIGYYPKARLHYRVRPIGCEQNILIYCIEGFGSVTVNSSTFDIAPGDFFVIPAHLPHRYKSDEKSPWTIYWCHFKGEQSDAIVQAIIRKASTFKSKIEFSGERINLFNKLYTNLEKGYSQENLVFVNLLFLQFLSTFLYSDRSAAGLKNSTDDLLERSILYMQENIDQNLNLANLAGHINYSPSHYSYRFRNKMGFSPIGYFNQLKIQKACQYLQFTDLRVNEISNKVGISDAYYFTRLFKKTMGFSPKQYRDQLNQ